MRAIARMPEYGSRPRAPGQGDVRYHVVGAHGGAWIYEVDSHEEFERLLAMAPVFNFAPLQRAPAGRHVGARAVASRSSAPVYDELGGHRHLRGQRATARTPSRRWG